MNSKTIRGLMCATAICSSATGMALANDLIPIAGSWQAGGVSADGSLVVGTAGLLPAQGFVWTEATGTQPLGGLTLSGYFSSMTAADVSADGSIVTGTATSDVFGAETAFEYKRAFLWSQEDGFVDLGDLGSNNSVAYGISGDGTVVVGYSADASARTRAFRWTEGTGMVSLGQADDSETNATAWAASGDGSVIVGTSNALVPLGPSFYDSPRAFVWTDGSSMSLLSTLGTPASAAYDVSNSGNVIVGSAQYQGTSSVAVRWLDGEIMALDGFGGSIESSIAYGVSGNGEVIVGQNTGGVTAGFRWTEAGGMQSIEDWLRSSGVTIADATTLSAKATNDDGSVIIGTTWSNELFIARGSETQDGGTSGGDGGTSGDGDGSTGGDEGTSGGGAGLITLNDLNTSLASSGASNASTLNAVGVLLNGAGSRPLDRRAPVDRNIIWSNGDLGRDDHASRDGAFGLGEVGGGHNFGAVQINGALGVNSLSQHTMLGGHTEAMFGYAKIEALSQLHATDIGGIWAAITGTALIGQANISRNYLANGGSVDTSNGTSGISGFGVRARLQWENMVQNISPYVEGSHSRACLDAYTETDGSFPASYDQNCNTATEARLGVDVRVPLNDTFSVIGTAEAVHRFEPSGSNVTGNVLGLGAFNIASAPYQQNWVRGGLGVQMNLGDTMISLTGNLTTAGEAPSAWVAGSVSTVF